MAGGHSSHGLRNQEARSSRADAKVAQTKKNVAQFLCIETLKTVAHQSTFHARRSWSVWLVCRMRPEMACRASENGMQFQDVPSSCEHITFLSQQGMTAKRRVLGLQ